MLRSGALTLLRGRAYDAEVSYLPAAGDAPADGAAQQAAPRAECRAECRVCRAPALPAERLTGKDAPFMRDSRKALDEAGWVHVQASALDLPFSSGVIVGLNGPICGRSC